MTQVQKISSNKQNNSKNYLLAAGLGGSLVLGSLHGIAKEFDIDFDTYAASREYREKLKFLKDSGRTEEYFELLNAPKRVAIKIKGLKKILHPVDQWIFNAIDKISKGYKLVDYLNKPKFSSKPLFGKLHYTPKLIAKGALFTGSIYAAIVGICKIINKIRKKNN